jgi:hypothetical protein
MKRLVKLYAYDSYNNERRACQWQALFCNKMLCISRRNLMKENPILQLMQYG